MLIAKFQSHFQRKDDREEDVFDYYLFIMQIKKEKKINSLHNFLIGTQNLLLKWL